MTDEDLTGAAEARERARLLLARAAARRAGQTPEPMPEPAAVPTPGQPRGLHELLRDMAAYLGDRPQKDRDAMGLYDRVMRVLGEGGS